jgi:hypothetical protein
MKPLSLGKALGMLMVLIWLSHAHSACLTQDAPLQNNRDPLARLLQTSETCPEDILALRSRLESAGATLKTTLVANHGFHPPAGPLERKVHFMLFEMASGRVDSLGMTVGEGEFFFGHFVVPSAEDKLTVGVVSFIELIAWDASKGVFNFYEFTRDRGDTAPRWHYRGDSLDILTRLGSRNCRCRFPIRHALTPITPG